MYYCRSLPPYSGQYCWHSEGAPFVAYTIVKEKTLRLSSAKMFVRLYRLLLIHCIYVSVTNQLALPLVPGWILVPSDPWRWQKKLLCSVVTALISTICAALLGQSNVGSMCDCKPCWSLDLSGLVEILSGVDSDHAWYRSQKERQCQLKVNSMSNRKKVMLTKDAPLSSHLAVYVL